MNEIYLEVKEFGGRILVSNLGKVYSMKGNRILPQHLTGKYYKQGRGYPSVYIREAKGARKVHRMVAEAFLEDWDKALQVDHIDGNGLNNQKVNMRECSTQENSFNQKRRKNTTSKFKGVSWYKRRSVWEAYIHIDYSKKKIGYFDSELDAAIAYNVAAVEHFGEFARMNTV